ncbi:MAG TPA: hypothetical protein VMC08_04845 [Bacteroidales bacterium]|nr:hypothetical protein [Bacteroidales bacterium]
MNEPHRIYEGHFPGNPVVPGVCQVALIRELVSGILGKNLRLETADNIKFLSMIQPGVQKRLKVDLEIKDAAEGKQEVQALISADEKIFMKFKGQFKPGG